MLRAIEHVRYPPSVRVSDKAGAENTGDAQDKKRQKNTPKRYTTPGCKSLTIGFCRNESLGGQGRVRRALSNSHNTRADRCKGELQLASQCSPVLTRAEDTRVSPGGLRARQGDPPKKDRGGAAKRPTLTDATAAHA
jgi:hypothetical protein